MLQYSYSPVAPVPAEKFGVEAKIARYVLWNFPPASVWRYTRKAAYDQSAPPGPLAGAPQFLMLASMAAIANLANRLGREACQ